MTPEVTADINSRSNREDVLGGSCHASRDCQVLQDITCPGQQAGERILTEPREDGLAEAEGGRECQDYGSHQECCVRYASEECPHSCLLYTSPSPQD